MVDFRVYLITDNQLVTAPGFLEVEESLRGGIGALQLRDRERPIRDLLAMASTLREMTERYGAKLFINDRVDVALSVRADGVHLGQKSMPPGAVRRIVGREMLIGVSTHRIEEALRAEKGGADFVTFGPVFETPSKRRYGPPVGLDLLKEVAEKLSIPVFGLGGIRTDNAADVLLAGVSGIALISAVLASDDREAEAKKFVRLVS